MGILKIIVETKKVKVLIYLSLFELTKDSA